MADRVGALAARAQVAYRRDSSLQAATIWRVTMTIDQMLSDAEEVVEMLRRPNARLPDDRVVEETRQVGIALLEIT